jgi:subtilisin
LKHDPRVLAVEPDGPIIPAAQTIPTGVLRMGLTNFPVAQMNGTDQRIDVDVAVMDTGIQTNHPDLNVVQAADFTGEGNNGEDWNGHGTHVAGTIGALDNDMGVVGVAPGVRLWSVQVLGQFQSEWSMFIAGCDYISSNANQIAVVNASLTGIPDSTSPWSAIHQAVSNLVNQGIVFVAAAGNSRINIGGQVCGGRTSDVLPAFLPEVMAVSSMDPTNDTIAFSSNYSLLSKCPSLVDSPGLGMDVAAPGVNILSTYTNSDYATLSGTSMSCAHASGVVALYIAANGRAHSLQDVINIRQTIVDNSQPQSAWSSYPNTADPDHHLEPLAIPSDNWIPLPTITSASVTSGIFQVSLPAVPGYNYTLQFCNSLSQSNQWTDLTTVSGTGSVATATVVDPTPPSDMRFYRLDRTPAP